VKLKISGLWASAMFCYLYGDIFWLYKPGKLQEMISGVMPPFGPVTQGVLLTTSIMMTIPAVMVFLSLALPPRTNRWMNIALGLLYSVFVLLTMRGAWTFYLLLGGVSVVLTSLVVWYAWTWPRLESTQ